MSVFSKSCHLDLASFPGSQSFLLTCGDSETLFHRKTNRNVSKGAFCDWNNSSYIHNGTKWIGTSCH